MERVRIERGGVTLSYGRRGEGPPIVLVHGLGLSGDLWLRLPDRLAASGFTVLTPDNRGTGRSDAPRPPYRMADLADDVAAVMADADVGPAVVVGISLGGMIAQHLALRHPERVAGLVLAATTPGVPFGRLPGPRAIASLLASVSLPSRVSRIHRLLVHPVNHGRARALLAPIEAEIAAVPAERRRNGFLGQFAAAALHSVGHRIGRIRVPTEVIVGEVDPIIPPRNARILARRIPGAQLTVVPQTGHVFPLEDPAAYEAAIRRVAVRAFGAGGEIRPTRTG